jgi:transposase
LRLFLGNRIEMGSGVVRLHAASEFALSLVFDAPTRRDTSQHTLTGGAVLANLADLRRMGDMLLAAINDDGGAQAVLVRDVWTAARLCFGWKPECRSQTK